MRVNTVLVEGGADISKLGPILLQYRTHFCLIAGKRVSGSASVRFSDVINWVIYVEKSFSIAK